MAEAAVHSLVVKNFLFIFCEFRFYMEGRNYNYATGHLRPDFYRQGHFTQMVWKASRRIGIGNRQKSIILDYLLL